MGRYAYSYNYVGVEISISEARKILSQEVKNYEDKNYSNDSSGDFEVLELFCSPINSSLYKYKVFASFNYEDKSINGIYYGVLISKNGISVDAEGWTSNSTFSSLTVTKYFDELKKLFPQKSPKIINIINCI